MPSAMFLLSGMLSCILLFGLWLETLCDRAGHVEACAVVNITLLLL